MGRAPLDVDRTAIVRDRLAGMSLTDVATKHLVSRASVVRFTREAQRVMCVLGSIPVGQQRKAIAAVACIA
jgi:hypothetical protein